MRKMAFVLSFVLIFSAYACSDGSDNKAEKSTDKAEKSGIYEPKTQQEFVKILDELNIKPYMGAEITDFKTGSNSEMTYQVSSKGNTNKAIMGYYKKAFEDSFKDNPDWKPFMSTPISVIYRKGFDLTMTFMVTSKNAAREMFGSTDSQAPEYLTYVITLGDDSVSY